MAEDRKRAHDKPLSLSGTTGTRGFYRFSADFPNDVDAQGLRTEKVRRRPRARKLRLAILFVVVFALSFTVWGTLLGVSRMPLTEEASRALEHTPAAAVSGYRAVMLPGSVLSSARTEAIISQVSAAGADTVVFRMKDPDGHLYFDPSLYAPSDAEAFEADHAERVVGSFKASGFRVFAYLSCFADDTYARTYPESAAYVSRTAAMDYYGEELPDEIELWYDGREESHAWVSPFADDVMYYVRTLVSDACALGVDGVLLDGVRLPYETDAGTSHFPGNENGTRDDVNERMAAFVTETTQLHPEVSVGVVEDLQSVLQDVSVGRMPGLWDTGVEVCAIDCDLSLLPGNVSVGDRLFTDPAGEPVRFLTAALGLTRDVCDAAGAAGALMPVLYTDSFTSDAVRVATDLGLTAVLIRSEDGQYE